MPDSFWTTLTALACLTLACLAVGFIHYRRGYQEGRREVLDWLREYGCYQCREKFGDEEMEDE